MSKPKNHGKDPVVFLCKGTVWQNAQARAHIRQMLPLQYGVDLIGEICVSEQSIGNGL